MSDPAVIHWKIGDPWRDFLEEIHEWDVCCTVTLSQHSETLRIMDMVEGTMTRVSSGTNKWLTDGQPRRLPGVLTATPCGFAWVGLELSTPVFMLCEGIPTTEQVDANLEVTAENIAKTKETHPPDPCGAAYCYMVELEMS